MIDPGDIPTRAEAEADARPQISDAVWDAAHAAAHARWCGPTCDFDPCEGHPDDGELRAVLEAAAPIIEREVRAAIAARLRDQNWFLSGRSPADFVEQKPG